MKKNPPSVIIAAWKTLAFLLVSLEPRNKQKKILISW